MKLQVLVDNNTFIDMYYLGEPAVSYYIEDEDTKILFDTGYSNIFIDNAKKMNIDLNNIDKIVLSHGHNDHTRGLNYLDLNDKKDLICHEDALNYKELDHLSIGIELNKKQLEEKYNLNIINKPIQISKNITYLGEIPTCNDFEPRKVIGQQKINNKLVNDLVLEDTAIVYKHKDGLFIITGCSHAGICNIVEYAKEVCNDSRILGIIGGFHLFEVNDQILKTIEYFKANNIQILYPCHCVSLDVKIEMAKKLKINEVGVGLVLEI